MARVRPTYVWVLKSNRKGFFNEALFWIERGRYGQHLGGIDSNVKNFVRREEAEDWLFLKQIRRGRKVDNIEVKRISCARLLARGYKWRRCDWRTL